MLFGSALVEQSKREEAYVQALATEYDSIAVIRFMPDKADDKVILHSRAGETDGEVDEATTQETIYSKKLDMFSRYVHPEDRETFLAETRREKILESFAENRTHVVDFHFCGRTETRSSTRCVSCRREKTATCPSV